MISAGEKPTVEKPPESCDFRLYLQGALAQRCRLNPKYTLRAFARQLGVDHSTLSQIMRGKRSLSRRMIERLGLKLGLSPSQVCSYTSKETAKAPDSAQELTLDAFQVIADWYHYSIFELVTLKSFQPDPRWIAKMLGVTVSEVNIAVDRLKRLGLIEIDETGRWRQGVPLITTTGNPFTATAFRRLQHQVLQMAQKALEETPMDLRDQSSMTMAINSRRLPEAKERIKKFRRELCDFLQQDQDRDSVFQLGVSFFPLTPVSKKRSE